MRILFCGIIVNIILWLSYENTDEKRKTLSASHLPGAMLGGFQCDFI